MTEGSKRLIDLSVAACRKRQSLRTGFVHLYYSLDAATSEASDTIPLYENFCFAFALIRQKTAESVLEGKLILDKLFAFQTEEGYFPTYLHEFPKCKDFSISFKIAAICKQILIHFSSIIGVEIKEKLEKTIEKAILFTTNSSLQKRRILALQGKEGEPFFPSTNEEWFEEIINRQLLGLKIENVPFDRDLQIFTCDPQLQEKGEPMLWPMEWALSEKDGFSERLLRDHPAVIRAAALWPIEYETPFSNKKYLQIVSAKGGIQWFWKEAKIHSLCAPYGVFKEDHLTFSLQEAPILEKGGAIEAALFSDLSSDTKILIEGKTSTVFHLGDEVRIQTVNRQFLLRFSLLEGSGDFIGQISRANRPGQIAAKGNLRYEAFDWQIAIKTLRRDLQCTLRMDWSIEELLP